MDIQTQEMQLTAQVPTVSIFIFQTVKKQQRERYRFSSPPSILIPTKRRNDNKQYLLQRTTSVPFHN